MPTGLPTTTSPPRERQASVKIRSLRSSCARLLAKLLGSTMRQWRPLRRLPRRVNMRLRILDNGHGFGTKALFALIRAASRQPVLDIIKLVKYRPDFYGDPMSDVTQEAMRGPSPWSIGDRELMAAFIAKTNQCEFCTKAH